MNLNKYHWRKWMLSILLLAGLAMPALGASGNIAESRLANEGHRFLLVVETSKTMQRYGEAAVNAIHQLLGSEMQKQLRPGDSIGVWTYNDELYTGKLPSQEWNPTDSKVIYNRILKFIIEQKFEKTGIWHKALPTIARVVKDSQLITVILVSDGEEDIAGTPYDQEINAFYATWRDKQRKAQKPFITVFRGENGKLTHYSICPVPWAADIPALPPGRDSSQLAQARAGQTKPTAQHIGKPLIVTGPPRKYEPIETPATVPPPPTAATVVAPSGQPVPSAPSAALPQPTESTLVQPSTLPAPRPVTQTLAQPPAQAVVKDARQEVADMIISNLLAEAGKPQAQEPSTKVIVVGSAAAHSPTVAGTNHLNSAVNTGATSATTVSTVTKPATNALPAKVPEPVVVAKSQSAPEKAESTQAKATAPASVSPTVAATSRASTKEPPARSEGFFARRGTQNVALALAAGALACLFIAVRRPKPVYRPSIITRSLEREPR